MSVEEETEKAIYLLVRGDHDAYKVRIARDHTFSCTCPYATMHGIPKGALCSHAVAAIVHLSTGTGGARS
ncbi:MAG: hypothetical protein ACRDH5_14410 [bacterium]